MRATPVRVMAAGNQRTGGDVLAAWAEGLASRREGMQGRGCLRFAFNGRVSTEDWQDPVTSRARQLQQAVMLTAGRGVIVAEFFDTGQSRSLPWARRPQAAALVGQLADPDRGWDAIVIGEYERAFYGNQYASMAPLFEHYGIGLWMPEVGGRVDWHAEDHEQTMLALGLSSKREITRTRIRVRTAMPAQTREQGRYLGGRPPYGYRLADAGPHPNKAHAAWGRRAHRLEPDPATAPVVTWMFAQRLAGHSAARIARALNDAGVPCPSAADPGRNPHRTGAAWTLRTVAAIQANPRYTGRQVWNRQRTDFDLADPANTTLGHRQVQRWNLPEGWVISKHPAHAALVSEADFIAVQDTAAARGPGRPGGTPVPAGRDAGLRAVRAAAGISVVQRQARLPVPSRPHQRDPPRTRTAPEHLRA
jgi:site-specific DNA recombinase